MSTQELMQFPPEGRAIVSFPLVGEAVVQTVEADEVAAEAGPEAVVEDFLVENSTLFAMTEDAWGAVKLCQNEFTAAMGDAGTGGLMPDGSLPSRSVRRAQGKGVKGTADPLRNIGGIKHDADMYYGYLVTDKTLTAEMNDELVTTLVAEGTAALAELGDSVNAPDGTSMAAGDTVRRLFTSEYALRYAVVYARYRQGLALDAVKGLLADDAAVPVFVERLKAMAQDKEDEYSGLLELLATHTREAGRQKNMLAEAITRTAGDQSDNAEEFLRAAQGGSERMPKELRAALGVMRIAAHIFGEESSMDESRFLALFAGKLDEWPSELVDRLAAYSQAKVVNQYGELANALGPYIRVGRLPVQGEQTDVRSHVRTQNKSRGRRQVTSHVIAKDLFVAASKVDYGDVAGETVRQPIERFAVLVSAAARRGVRFALREAASLADARGLSNIDDYVAKYARGGDASVGGLIDAALEHLLTNPTDPACTRRLVNVRYELELGEDKLQQRRPRRFSGHDFAFSGKSSTASATRLIYDVVSQDGERTLVLYGAAIKQDIERMNMLPSLR